MPRTNLPKTTAKGAYPTLPIAANSLDIVFTAADVANKNEFVPTGNDLVLAWNSGASVYTATATSAPDPQNRTGDIGAYSIDAGEIAHMGPVRTLGWVQPDGKVYLEANNAAIKFAVIALP
ncbi:MAG: hypothetical protein CVU44_21050 [Chloroflexi bacterium HGW-Chloroflexi-6]|nr:MAG: hypothetical protein CVU44_21050 [Chloroflexi bacterium HGW-Chloroflexi-6]